MYLIKFVLMCVLCTYWSVSDGLKLVHLKCDPLCLITGSYLTGKDTKDEESHDSSYPYNRAFYIPLVKQHY